MRVTALKYNRVNFINGPVMARVKYKKSYNSDEQATERLSLTLH